MLCHIEASARQMDRAHPAHPAQRLKMEITYVFVGFTGFQLRLQTVTLCRHMCTNYNDGDGNGDSRDNADSSGMLRP